ncbi:MAG: T9SS type A sorting domain-containing protein, partial [Bacteroidota bacterium]
ESSEERNVKVYPNPFRSSFNVEFYLSSEEQVEIAIFDISGRQVYKRTMQRSGLVTEKIIPGREGILLLRLKIGDDIYQQRIVSAEQISP